MAGKKIPKQLKKTINEFIENLQEDELPIDKVILFGSYAKGNPHEWSDVDVCVLSPKFDNWFTDMQYLMHKTPDNIKYAIEPVGYNSKDYREALDPLVCDIQQHGIEIPI